jgi:predicted flap endonuclease-1-like 5' DNA nuclease
MKYLPNLILILLGLVIGFIVTWAFRIGPSVGLFVGVMLVLAGAIAGFFAEWYIDEAHRKNRDQIEIKVQASIPEGLPQSEATVLAGFLTQRDGEVRELRDKLSATEQALTECRFQREEQARELEGLPSLKARLTGLESELVDWKLKPNEIQAKLESAQLALADFHQRQEVHLAELDQLRNFKAKIEAKPEDLTVIKGIGKIYQRRLYDIGITTMQQLSTSDPARLRRMLGVKPWQAADVASWVIQAMDWIQRVA